MVVGVDAGGVEVARLELGHGEDPSALLASHGWRVRRVRDVTSHRAGKHVLTFSFGVDRLFVAEGPFEAGRADVAQGPLGEQSFVVEQHPAAPNTMREPRRDEDLTIVRGETPFQYQRVAAYACVTSTRGFLMTQFSDRTNAPGLWGLPGGGLEADEAPERAVVREVWEESGQVIEVSGLAMVNTSHWVGRAPAGRLEDFHAVRVVYRAVCPEPTEPTVHDVGGTTASAAWVSPTDLDRLEVAAGWRSLLSAVLMAPGEADSPQHDEQGTDADNRAGPQA
jgi:8-oxo-dGTP pyrophosphatase MutT (NUDIX family)